MDLERQVQELKKELYAERRRAAEIEQKERTVYGWCLLFLSAEKEEGQGSSFSVRVCVLTHRLWLARVCVVGVLFGHGQ